MSKLTRLTPRSRSRSERSFGSVKSSHSYDVGYSRSVSTNDPALHINQFGITKPEPQVQIQTIIKYDKTKEKEFLEKEKKLNAEIATLKKIITQLKLELKESCALTDELKQQISTLVQEHDSKVIQLEIGNQKLQEELTVSQDHVEQLHGQVKNIKEDYEEQIRTLKEDYERRIKEMDETHTKDLAERDSKMELMKNRVSEMLGKKSNERQRQLEELKHDLIERGKEAKQLQHQLRQFTSQPCKNCEKLESLLEERTLQLRLKEKTLNEMQNMGKKMKVQLLQQEVLVNIMEQRESTGK